MEKEKSSHRKQIEDTYDPFANHPSMVPIDAGDDCDQRHLIDPGPAQVMGGVQIPAKSRDAQ